MTPAARFLRTLLGINQPDAGRVLIEGEGVHLHSVRDAQARGVDAVHQDLALAPHLSVVDNMLLGTRPPSRDSVGAWASPTAGR